MKANYTTVTPVIDGLNIDDLRQFLKCIKYSNTVICIDGVI